MNPIPKHRIVFDIDEVLVCSRAMYVSHVRFFRNKGSIFFIPVSDTEKKTHYVFPAVRELLQKLCSIETVQLSFFSAGIGRRNIQLVEQLLTDSVGHERYLQIKDRISVFSREHLTPSLKKDLQIAASEEIPLKETILVDDTPMNMLIEQIDHLLYVPASRGALLHRFDSKCSYYEKEGYRFLKIYFEKDHLPWWNRMATRGNAIVVVQTRKGFDLAFVDEKTHKFRRIAIAKKDHEELLQALKEEYERKTTPDKYPSWILEKIRTIVSSEGGKTTKIWRSANRIYYVAGCIFTALEKAQNERISLSEALASIYTPRSHLPDVPISVKNILSKNDALYRLGLEKLQEVNPHLAFTTPHSYKEHANGCPLVEFLELSAALDHELD